MKVALHLGLGVVVIGAGLIGANEFRAQRQASEIKAKIALLKSHGWPTCGDDMPKAPPEASNAFLVLAPHIARNKETYAPKNPIIRGVDASVLLEPADEGYLRKGVELDRELLEITARAFRERKEFFIPHKWDSGMMLLLPEYAGLKSLQKVLLGEVVLAVRAGRMDEARERLGWIHRVQSALAAEPIVIGRLVGRSMMISERKCLMRLLEQGAPVMPLLKEARTAWRGYSADLEPLVGVEMMSTLATIRYLDTPNFWRYQSLPWSLWKGRHSDIEEGASVKTGVYVPKVGAARAKLLEALDGYLAMDSAVGGRAKPGHVSKAMEANEELWSTIPAFSGFSVGPSSGEPSAGASMELLRLEPEILDFLIRVVERRESGEKVLANIDLGVLTSADGLKFLVSTEGEKVVLQGVEGTNKVFRATYPVELDTPYASVASGRASEFKRIEEALKPSTKTGRVP